MKRFVIAFLLVLQVAAPGAETLRAKQSRFAGLVSRLLAEATRQGYEVTLGEAWRSPEQAMFKALWNEQHGIGIANSLHILRLAIDLNLFRAGSYLTETRDYQPLGQWWEKQCRDCRWGGRFKRPDGNHFSIENGGIQ